MTRKKDDKSNSNLMFPLDMSSILQMQQDSFKNMTELHQQFIAGAATYNEEMLSFVNRRFKEDMETASAFAECTTPQEGYKLYMEFVRKAMEQYAEEAERMSSLSNRMFGDVMKASDKAETKSAKKNGTGKPV